VIKTVVDRWFGGIPKKGNIWYGSTIVADVNLDNYVFSYQISKSTSKEPLSFTLFGCPLGELQPCILLNHPAINSDLPYEKFCYKQLKEQTISYPLIKSVDADKWIVGCGVYVKLVKIGSRRTINQLIIERNDVNSITLNLEMFVKDVNEWVFERQISHLKPIIQPIHQGGPEQGSIADELFVVSESANDTVAGTGLRKLRFTYYDQNLTPHISDEISMNGLTPVNLISLGYNDVYLFNKISGTEFGSLGHNDGNIYFQDAV
jgi:hypothetical protein